MPVRRIVPRQERGKPILAATINGIAEAVEQNQRQIFPTDLDAPEDQPFSDPIADEADAIVRLVVSSYETSTRTIEFVEEENPTTVVGEGDIVDLTEITFTCDLAAYGLGTITVVAEIPVPTE